MPLWERGVSARADRSPTAADVCECRMEMLTLRQEFLGTCNVHIREMFYITPGMVYLVWSLQRDCWRKYENSISGL